MALRANCICRFAFLLSIVRVGTVLAMLPALVGCGESNPAPTSGGGGGAGPAVSETRLGGSNVERGKSLYVFAAASLTESFTELGKQFESAHPDVKVYLSFGASQQLRGQIEQGAVADVFASANTREMDALVAGKLVDTAAVKIFARNRLLIIYPKDNPARITVIKDLSRPGLKINVADIAVPVGKYTDAMLDQISRDPAYGPDFKARFTANVVSREENVKSVVTKVWLGEADAGVVYVSDIMGSAGKELGSLPIPDNFNQIASYPIAALSKAPHAVLAKEFVELLLSPAGQAVLKKYGLEPVEK